MGLLFPSRRSPKEGPGFPPPQGGAALYFYLVKTYFWQLLWLNWVFLLSCIPVVTIPAALTALSRVCLKLVREGTALFWLEYKTEFRRSFGKSIPFGLLFGGALFGSYYLLSLGLTNGESLFGLLFSGAGLCLLVLGVGWGSYAFVLLAAQDLPVRTLLKNAWYLMLLGGKATAAVLVTVAVSGGLVLLLFPVSLSLPALGLVAVTQFTVCWFVHIPLNDHVFRPYARTNPDHSEEP